MTNSLYKYTERNFQRKMKFRCLYFIHFCIKRNQIWRKQRIIHDTINGYVKSVDKSQIVQHKVLTQSKGTFQYQKLRVSFSIYFLSQTSHYLAFAIYALAKFPEKQAILTAEIDKVVNGKDITASHMGHMPYLRAVLKETLR